MDLIVVHHSMCIFKIIFALYVCLAELDGQSSVGAGSDEPIEHRLVSCIKSNPSRAVSLLEPSRLGNRDYLL